jgi:hypothetical protein
MVNNLNLKVIFLEGNSYRNGGKFLNFLFFFFLKKKVWLENIKMQDDLKENCQKLQKSAIIHAPPTFPIKETEKIENCHYNPKKKKSEKENKKLDTNKKKFLNLIYIFYGLFI